MEKLRNFSFVKSWKNLGYLGKLPEILPKLSGILSMLKVGTLCVLHHLVTLDWFTFYISTDFIVIGGVVLANVDRTLVFFYFTCTGGSGSIDFNEFVIMIKANLRSCYSIQTEIRDSFRWFTIQILLLLLLELTCSCDHTISFAAA